MARGLLPVWRRTTSKQGGASWQIARENLLMRAFHVLLAEPDSLLLAACRFYLVGQNVQLTGVATGAACQDRLGRERPDLLILDCDLPGPPPEEWLFPPGQTRPPTILLVRPGPETEGRLNRPGLTVILKPISPALLALLIGSIAPANGLPDAVPETPLPPALPDGEKVAPWGKIRQAVRP